MLGNLRAIANSQTRSVNPNVPARLMVSMGFTTINFVQTPLYDSLPVMVQVQAMTSGDALKMDALNIQGAEKIMFVNGLALAINRIQKRGGDLLVFQPGLVPEGTTWKIITSMEQWGYTWAKVAVALQDDDLSGAGRSMDFSIPGKIAITAAL
jgi:hypothetical protein